MTDIDKLQKMRDELASELDMLNETIKLHKKVEKRKSGKDFGFYVAKTVSFITRPFADAYHNSNARAQDPAGYKYDQLIKEADKMLKQLTDLEKEDSECARTVNKAAKLVMELQDLEQNDTTEGYITELSLEIDRLRNQPNLLDGELKQQIDQIVEQEILSRKHLNN